MRDEHPAGWRVLVGGELSQRTRQRTRSRRDRSSWTRAASLANCSELPRGEQAFAQRPRPLRREGGAAIARFLIFYGERLFAKTLGSSATLDRMRYVLILIAAGGCGRI